MQIPIILSTDEEYSYYAYVTIYSIIKNASREYAYNIYVLHASLDDEKIQLLESLSVDNIQVECKDISKYISGIEFRNSGWISVAAFYRFFIPKIFNIYSKILYIDSDIVLTSDIADLYKLDISEYPIGAVPELPCKLIKNHIDDLGHPDYRFYFNSGVLLINVELFEKLKIRERCLERLEIEYSKESTNYIYTDQDLLNMIILDNYYKVGLEWNYQIQYLGKLEQLDKDFVDYYEATSSKASLIHYASNIKPWNNRRIEKGDLFWKTLYEAPMGNEIQREMMFKQLDARRELESHFLKFKFPYSKVPYGSNIILYGAGKVGTAFYHQMKQSEYANILCWVDKNLHNSMDDVYTLEYALHNIKEYDYYIIGVLKETIVDEIRELLISKGVDEDKIVTV